VHRRLVATVLALTATAAASVAGVASASGTTKAPLRYVALGDSYSAASGVLPADPAAPPQCLRSTRNYPKVLASKVSTTLVDVTCGAADTDDFFAPQYQNVPAQLEAVKKDTQLITMTIGGNDSGVFINAILQCGAAGATSLGQGSPCKDQYGSSFETTVKKTTYPSLVKALKAVRAKAPKAKVGILSYPWIVPTSVGCYPQMPVATGDVPYLRHLQATLNDAVRRAAAATGATYVDLNQVSNGHDACQPIGVRWVEPVLAGTNPVIVHPNALGESKMAEQAIKVLKLG
jgi:lysophospholipase L1-like esterase